MRFFVSAFLGYLQNQVSKTANKKNLFIDASGPFGSGGKYQWKLFPSESSHVQKLLLPGVSLTTDWIREYLKTLPKKKNKKLK